MPELPEVETVTRGINNFAKGKKATRIILRRADLRIPFTPGLAETLAGAVFVEAERFAKYIFMAFDTGDTLVIHLGMSGRISFTSPGDEYIAEKHDHMSIFFADGSVMTLSDARRFGSAQLFRTDGILGQDIFLRCGVDPLDPPLSGNYLYRLFSLTNKSVKAALMDHTLVAGIGNIYACEALYAAGVHPETPTSVLKRKEVQELAKAIVNVLVKAIDAGGSTLKDYRQANGELGYFQHNFKVYGKAGQPCGDCVCGGENSGGVVRMTQSGRSSFFCPYVQKHKKSRYS